ncbi:type I-E CRISPR-associated protein Cas6/Cse3/CasE [Compostimonas suwonensis]|uniref:CRISPR system Cascade subunit CasE n=1 Tax=Compostimonas suwonensis TaxID=1048394 RepID=A0A2M9C3T2_9MICO|nr:type I-E CRISPR-associated protein Cas6/Cse3/CasE [Compostimonas suwonensis]PJJ65186.1 CRISPR system Cascade subunit CasE [Compostimonas suwonensis]
MFLTRMFLNPARRGTRLLVSSPQAMHAAVLAGFAPDTADSTASGRTLWRLDHEAHQLMLLVASPTAPDFTHLIEQAGWPTSSTWDTIDYTGFLSQITRGQHYAFRIFANPVRTPRDPELEGKIVGHVTARQQASWLIDRTTANGFQVMSNDDGEPQLLVSNREKKSFRRGSATVTLATAQFDGRLEVTDVDALRRALTFGIGRAKGYGCGLLTLARL